MTNITAIPDLKAPAGAVTYWRLSGSIDIALLEKIWPHEKSLLPSLPGPIVALRRALRSFQTKHTLVRRVPKQRGTFAVVREHFEEGKPQYTRMFTAFVEQESSDDDPVAIVEDGDHFTEDEVDIRFERARRTLTSRDLSVWLVRLAYRARAVALRESGGIYFVPEDSAKWWSQVADTVRQIGSSRVYEIPAMRTERAVEAVLDAMIAEAAAEVTNMDQELELASPGERRLKSRAMRCDQMLEKVASYEKLLDADLSRVREQVTELKARVSMALLQAEADSEQ